MCVLKSKQWNEVCQLVDSALRNKRITKNISVILVTLLFLAIALAPFTFELTYYFQSVLPTTEALFWSQGDFIIQHCVVITFCIQYYTQSGAYE